jgi:DNA-binding response OmpR family regulator
VHVVVFARHVQLAALVKERFDRRRVGLTEIVDAEQAMVSMQAVSHLNPDVLVLVGHRLDALVWPLCQRCGQDPSTREVPLVVVLEQASEAERIAALDAGACSVVQPFDLNVIEWRMLASCARANSHQVFRGGDLCIDANESAVTVSGKPITLTALEATLLRVLVHNRNRALSRLQLEQGIWGVTRSRTLDVHIARLRQKLGPLGSRIETVSKVGYCYVEPSSLGPFPLAGEG